MKLRKLFALLLALCLVVGMFAACTASEKPADPKPAADPAKPDDSAAPDDAEEPDDEDEEPEIEEVNYFGFMYTTYDTGKGSTFERVEEAINEITEREINVHVNFQWVALGDYATQLTLAISNKEPIDLAHYWYRGNITTMYAAGACMDITELAKEYAPDALEVVDWMAECASFEGRLYGIPSYRTMATSNWAIFRQDDLEKSGMLEKAQNLTTWSEMEEIFDAFVKTCDCYGTGAAAHAASILPFSFVLHGDKIADGVAYETLSDNSGCVSIENGVVTNLLKREGATEGPKLVADWMKKGYVYPDSAFSGDTNKTLLQMNTFGCLFQGSEYGVEGTYKSATGVDCVCVELYTLPNSASGAKGMGGFIPTSATNPTGGLKLLNLFWTNAELMNLINWGIEGESYVVKDGIACYPEGKDNGSAGYHLPDYVWGNQFICLPWEGVPATFREDSLAYEQSVPRSDYAGFTFDVTGYDDLLAGLSATNKEYSPSLCCGLYTDELFQEYVNKMDAAGADQWIALYQEQLDAFMA